MANESDLKVKKIDELTEAYQREILFLSTYKKELIDKKIAMDKSLGSKVVEAKKELNSLEKYWLKMQAENDLSMERLNEIERDFENRKENKEIIETTLKQAAMDEGVKEDLSASKLSLLDEMEIAFEKALTSLSQASQVSKKKGVFYSEDGEEKQGQIISMGTVARFAENDGRVASLYPTGDGNFKVWSWLDVSANSLIEKKIPEKLSFFLYENPNKEYSAASEKTLMDTLRAGGIIGWFILAMGVFALIISGVRFYLLHKASSRKTENLEQVIEKIKNNEVDEAQHLLVTENNSVSRVLNKTLSYLRTEPQKVDDAIIEAILKESKIIDRFGVVILVVASVAPLMGLLGTVTGMISTFDIITLYGTGNPKLLSGGISEALVTTMFGLIVAIPALLIGQFLSSKTESIKADMEKWALATCNAFRNKGDQA